MKLFAVLIILLFFSTGWSQSEKAMSQIQIEKFFIHKKRNFHLKKKWKKSDSTTINLDGIYLKELVYDNSDTSYCFLRFFPSGRVFYSGFYKEPPGIDDYYNLDYGFRGYYWIESGYVKIEMYINGYTRYKITEGVLNGQKLTFTKSKNRVPLSSKKTFHREFYFLRTIENKSNEDEW